MGAGLSSAVTSEPPGRYPAAPLRLLTSRGAARYHAELRGIAGVTLSHGLAPDGEGSLTGGGAHYLVAESAS